MPSQAAWTRLVFAVGLAAWIANAVALWLTAAPLGHDEAQYAIGASDLLAGHEERWFYLSRGMCYLAVPGVLAGGSEIAMRFLPMLFGIAFLLAAWRIARDVFGEATAAWTVAVLAGARGFMKHSAALLSDMPAAACLLAATAVILGELGREDGPRWRAVLVAPLFAAALYLRYASCVPIALLGLGWLAFGWRGIARRPAPVVAAAGLFALLLVPHIVAAIQLTGSPLGILLDSGDASKGVYTGEGLVGYLTSNPFVFYGLLAPPILLAGLASLRTIFARASSPTGSPDARGGDRRAVFLWLVAVTSIVAIGLIAYAQIRYIFLGAALLVILGVDAILRLCARASARGRAAIAAVAMAAIATSWVFVMASQLRRAGHPALVRAVEAIRKDAAGRPCQFVGYRYTQLEWYSGCRSAEFTGYPPLERGEWLYVVRDQMPGRQPPLSGWPGRHTTILQLPGVVQVVRVEPASDQGPTGS